MRILFDFLRCDIVNLTDIFKALNYKYSKVKKGRWVFSAFNGHYSDNPKYVSEKLHEMDPSAEIIWLVEKKYMSLVPDYVTCVDISDEEAIAFRNTAEIVVDNAYAQKVYHIIGDSFLAKQKGKVQQFLLRKPTQKIYTTWHGTPLKRMGRDQLGNEDICGFVCGNMTGFFNNRHTADILKHMTFDQMKTVLTGSPRNDLLFCDTAKTAELKEKLGLPKEKKVVLFAPTFRNDGKDIEGKNIERSGLSQLKEMDIPRLFASLSEKFGGEWVLICRFHYYVDSMVDWADLERKYPGQIINGNLHDDMAEYLACTDVLITDASSSMFDFALTKRPCFLYFPDLENYRSKERGFYMSLDELPFPCSEDFAGMIRQIEGFDAAVYGRGVDAMLDMLGDTDDGHASERVVNYILSECAGR